MSQRFTPELKTKIQRDIWKRYNKSDEWFWIPMANWPRDLIIAILGGNLDYKSTFRLFVYLIYTL